MPRTIRRLWTGKLHRFFVSLIILALASQTDWITLIFLLFPSDIIIDVSERKRA